MKLYIYYLSSNPLDFLFIKANDILEADNKIKSLKFNLNSYICGNLVIGLLKNETENRVFSYKETDVDGKDVLDEKGYTKYIREVREVKVEREESIMIQTEEDLEQFISGYPELSVKYNHIGIRITPGNTRYFLKKDLIPFLKGETSINPGW